MVVLGVPYVMFLFKRPEPDPDMGTNRRSPPVNKTRAPPASPSSPTWDGDDTTHPSLYDRELQVVFGFNLQVGLIRITAQRAVGDCLECIM